MRRWFAILCLASMFVGEVAHAKVLIVRPYISVVSQPSSEAYIQTTRNTRLLESIIRSTGGTYRTVNSRQTNNQWFRTGRQVWLSGTAGAYVEPFDASIATTHMIISASAGQFRADSLSTCIVLGGSGAVGSAVRTLVFRDNSPAVGGVEGAGNWGNNNGTLDSVGVTGVDDSGPGKAVYQIGTTTPFVTHAYTEAGISLEAGGANLRPILYSRVPAMIYRNSSADDGQTVACKWCDSLSTYTASDSLILWDKFWGTNGKGLGQATTITYASAAGAGAAMDSMADANSNDRPATEMDFSIMLAALAHLDSLVRADGGGGKVLGDKVIKVAAVVYGGLARGERQAWKSPGSAQGILNADTSAFYAGLDSLDALGIPVVFAVNPDSAATYARDIIKLRSVRMAKFTPQVWTGISDSTKAGAGYPVDVFGRYRKRAAYGDSAFHTVVGADSSIHWLAKRALTMTDSIFGRDRVSRVAVAPDDDWSPKNVTGADAGGVGIDSVLYALKQAGYVGVVADGQDPDANASKVGHGPSRTNPRGYYNQQRMYNSALVKDFKILTHSGYAIMGGRAQFATFNDSSGAAASGSLGTFFRELSRLYTGALMDFDESYDTWAYDGDATARSYDNIQVRKVDRTQAAVGRPAVRASIYRLAAADLSGVPYGGAGGAPALNGYWVLKSAKNAFDAINRLAGRTVITFAYPDDIEP